MYHPASINNHYNFISGFLEHLIMISKLANKIGPMYNIDQDLLITGTLLYNIGVIKEIKNIEIVEQYLNYLNKKLEVGMNIPEFQNLQNKKFNVNLNITGRDQQELFDNYKDANQLLHNCITY